jgi:pseudouridine synthase
MTVADGAPEPGPGVRLQKRMAELGLASRRGAEALISAGRVRVNGAVVTELGTRVDPLRDRIELDQAGMPPPGPAGFVLNKPVGYVTTKGEEEGPTILGLLPAEAAGMAYAGRLDKDSRGLVLLLSDGRLNYALTAPETHLEKEYLVQVDAKPSPGQLEKMARGMDLKDGPTRPCRVSAVGERGFRLWLTQGRKRQIRRMASKVGLEVTDLQRVRIGPLSLGPLAEGAWRELSKSEEAALRAAIARHSV